MKVVMKPGDKLLVEFENTDGSFEIDYDSKGDYTLTVVADLPDTSGREGVIYCEDFSDVPGDFDPEELHSPEVLAELASAEMKRRSERDSCDDTWWTYGPDHTRDSPAIIHPKGK